MSNIGSAKAYIQVEATRQRSAVSEFLSQTIGGAINYLNDQDTTNTSAISALNTHITNIAANSFLYLKSYATGNFSGTLASNDVLLAFNNGTAGFSISGSYNFSAGTGNNNGLNGSFWAAVVIGNGGSVGVSASQGTTFYVIFGTKNVST